MDIAFDPDLHLGPLRTSWHALFGIVAMAAGVVVGVSLAARRCGLGPSYNCALAGLFGGLVGSRLFHVVDEAQRYLADPASVLAVWNGGASITGGIVGGLLVGGLAARRQRLALGEVFDAGAVGLPVGMAVGRVGDLINGEHWATSCADLPWCVRYTHPATFGQREYVHPAVAYELVWDLVIALVLLALRRAGILRGAHALVFLGLYGIGRFALGAVRLDPLFALGMSQAQLVSIGFALFAVAGLLRRGPYARR